MKIFSSHRRKLEPRRRFGGREFQTKIKVAQNYKRVFSSGGLTRSLKLWRNLGVFVFIIIFYFFVISSYFVISDIKISGNSDVSTQQIQDAIAEAGRSRVFFIKKNNYFLLSGGAANKILTTSLPNIKQVVEYNRIWPNRVELTIKERTPGFLIKSNNKIFLVDDEGTVVSPIDGNPKNLLIAEDQIVEDFATGETLPNSKLAPFVMSMSKQWSSKVSVPVKTVKFPGKGSNDVQFETGEGWSVMFDTTRSVVSQLDSLAVILNKQIPAKDRVNLAYIDLRLSKWAYYCFKATPCHQQEQPEEKTNAEQ